MERFARGWGPRHTPSVFHQSCPRLTQKVRGLWNWAHVNGFFTKGHSYRNGSVDSSSGPLRGENHSLSSQTAVFIRNVLNTPAHKRTESRGGETISWLDSPSWPAARGRSLKTSPSLESAEFVDLLPFPGAMKDSIRITE